MYYMIVHCLLFPTDKAREEILEAGGVKKVLKKLKELQNKELKDCETRHHVTACGAVLNLSFDNGNSFTILQIGFFFMKDLFVNLSVCS